MKKWKPCRTNTIERTKTTCIYKKWKAKNKKGYDNQGLVLHWNFVTTEISKGYSWKGFAIVQYSVERRLGKICIEEWKIIIDTINWVYLT